MTISFTIPLIPKAQMRDRIGTVAGHAHSYKAAKQVSHEQHIMAAILKHKPATPILGPVTVTLTAYLAIPVSKPKWWKEAAKSHMIHPAGRPDLDNYQKQLLDCLTDAGFWHDDSQVVGIVAEKAYSASPNWVVQITELDNVTAAEWKEICGG